MQRKCGITGGVVGAIVMVVWALIAGWGGGQPTSAQTLDTSVRPANGNANDPAVRLARISPAIPIYDGASYRPDLSGRDARLVRIENDSDAEVWVLATEDAFPQVWHYYVSYLGQFRGWKPVAPYPRTSPRGRRLDLDLNQVMRDPFIPGDSLDSANSDVRLEIVETTSHPRTLIRYIVTPRHDDSLIAASRTPQAAPITKR